MRFEPIARAGLLLALSLTPLLAAGAAGCASKVSPAPAEPRAAAKSDRGTPLTRAPKAPAMSPAAVAATTKPTTAPVASSGAATFDVHHALTVKDIPAGTKKVRVWFWLPDDDDCQKLLDLVVADAPAGYRLTRDAANGHRYLYAEVDQPQTATVSLATDFVIRRHAVSIPVDPAKVGALTDVHRKLFAEYLRLDTPHMEVDEPVRRLAREICGDDTNVATQARKLAEWVVDHSDHYSIAGAPKSSGFGDAKYCLANKGGGCTDQHALFICLARARGIPTRLHFGSMLRAKNEGKAVDPGYRCWVQYFAPNYGWVPMDLSEADVNKGARELYLSGLDDHRVRFAEGRDLELNPRQEGPRVNVMIVAHVEVDGKPHAAFQRTLRFKEVRGEFPPPPPKAVPVHAYTN